LVTGAGTYIGDLSPTGMVHAEFVRSQYAHARITNIDTSEALATPGVVAVFTGADVNDKINPLPGASHIEGANNPKRTILADRIVRFMGEAIAVVVADSEEIARDAAASVIVDYDALPLVVDLEESAKDGAPLVHESLGTNICFHQKITNGDVDAAFAKADRIVERRIVNQRVAALPIECRASLAEYRRGEGSLVVYSGTAQAVTLGLWHFPLPVVAMVTACIATNARYLVMGAHLRQLFSGLPRRRVLPTLLLLADASWLMTTADAERNGADAGYFLGSSVPMAVGWIGGTALAYVLPIKPTGVIAVAASLIPLAFIVTLLPGQWRGARMWLPWSISAAAALMTAQFVGSSWAMLIGGAVGTGVSFLQGDDA